MMTAKINYNETDAFKRDFKKLSKKLRTLSDDIEIAKKNAIEFFHLRNINNRSVVLVNGYN